MTDKPAYKRRIIVVNKNLQFKFATVAMILFATAAFTIWWEITQGIKSLVTDGLIADPLILKTLSSINMVILAKVVMALILVWVLCLALSNLVAGPIYRVEKGLKALEEGDLAHRIHLRKGDQLVGLSEVFNRTAEVLEKRITEAEKK